MKKIKIFAIIHTEYTNTFDTLFYEAKKDDIFDWTFVIIPFKDERIEISLENIEKVMKEKKYPYIKGYDQTTKTYLDIKQFAPDITLLQTPYDQQRISYLYSSKYFSTFSRCYHVSYGSSLVDYDYPPYNEVLYQQDRLCTTLCESTEFCKILNKYNIHPNVPIGYIKCDKYINYKDNPDFTFKKRDQYKQIIAWKPRWIGTIGDSNLLTYLEFFITYCKKNPDTLLYFILHDLLRNEVVFRRRIISPKKFDSIMQEIIELPNIKIIGHDDFLDDVFNADIFIGDYCSTILEFSLTGKPVIYTPCDIVLSTYGKKIISGYYIVNNIDEMKKQINQLREKIDPLKKIRKNNIYLISDTHPNQSIAKYCLEYFKKLDYTVPINIKRDDLKEEKQITKTKLSCVNKIRYKMWKHLGKKLQKKGIIQ